MVLSTNNKKQNVNRETPLGLYFSDNQSQPQASKINLQLSSALLEDSLFLKQINVGEQPDDEFSAAHIYFPNAMTTTKDSVSWPVDQLQSQPFAAFCQDHRHNTDAELIQPLVLKLCVMLHLLHARKIAAYPVSADMIRISEQGEPLMLLLPVNQLEAMSSNVKKAFYPPLFSAPEVLETYAMNPQAFAYNIGVLTALLTGFPFTEQDLHLDNVEKFYHELLTWLKTLERTKPSMQWVTIIMNSLQLDPSARPYCPMKIHKALSGSSPTLCQE
jgi:hypothetical protein